MKKLFITLIALTLCAPSFAKKEVTGAELEKKLDSLLGKYQQTQGIESKFEKESSEFKKYSYNINVYLHEDNTSSTELGEKNVIRYVLIKDLSSNPNAVDFVDTIEIFLVEGKPYRRWLGATQDCLDHTDTSVRCNYANKNLTLVDMKAKQRKKFLKVRTNKGQGPIGHEKYFFYKDGRIKVVYPDWDTIGTSWIPYPNKVVDRYKKIK